MKQRHILRAGWLALAIVLLLASVAGGAAPRDGAAVAISTGTELTLPGTASPQEMPSYGQRLAQWQERG
ncbi:hypothetical protein, partial [Paenibacillus sp. 598K]|uniref:hypothetical protein n=1 Tax=Paenibacillus sp. 598K TaxID=1117987 RepID=UPI001628B08E